MSKTWGVAAIVAGAGILAYLIWRGRKSSSKRMLGWGPAPGQSITKTIAPGTTQTVTAWVAPTGETAYAQTTITKVTSPAWNTTIEYTSPSTATGEPTGPGLGTIIATNKKTGHIIYSGGYHIYWT
jgi:hypothetical protein